MSGFLEEDYSWMLEHVDKTNSSLESFPMNSGQEVKDAVEQRPSSVGNERLCKIIRKPEESTYTDSSELKERHRTNGETLRKLKLVKAHWSKNNLQTLEKLIQKWRESCQSALRDLLENSPKHGETSMQQLLQHLSINPAVIQFDDKTQTFLKTNKTLRA